MNKKQIEEKTESILAPIAEEHGCKVYDVEYVKEGKDYFLNCYIDKEGGVTINDCVDVNRPLSEALDNEDYIGGAYTLVVSSPGLGRTLTKDRHLSQSIGQDVDVKLFKPKDGTKVFTGRLTGFDDDTVTVETAAGEETFIRKEIAKLNLTLDL